MSLSFEMQQVESTLLHIENVAEYLLKISANLTLRAVQHDASKFTAGEWEYFLAHTKTLSALTYGSPEYRLALEAMRPAIEQHYSVNAHHPEHFIYHECNGCFKKHSEEMVRCECGCTQFTKRADISAMNLLDLIEMICDWLAATKRHADGDIGSSVELNQKRFGYSDELKRIMLNTVAYLEG